MNPTTIPQAAPITTKAPIRVYACGGAGINIAQQLESFRGKIELGFGQLEICYLDTSASNLRGNVPTEHSYVISVTDGNGKVRSDNTDVILQHIKPMLLAFSPADLNIVVSSGGGGSGSVIAPLIASELLKKDQQVVAMVVGSTDTQKDAQNTLATLKTYEAACVRATNKPLLLAYTENRADSGRAPADEEVTGHILALARLFSRQNHELDSRDTYNWLNFNRVTSHQPKLASLTIVRGTNLLDNVISHDIINVATLNFQGDATAIRPVVDCQYTGFLPENTNRTESGPFPMHFVITDGQLQEKAEQLQKFINDMKERQAARIVTKTLMSDSDSVGAGGLVFE